MKKTLSRIQNNFVFMAWLTGILLPAASVFPQAMDSSDVLNEARNSALAMVKNGDFKNARVAEEKALQAAESRWGALNPSIVPVLNDLAAIDWQWGDFPKAEKEYQWGLALRQKALPEDDPRLGDSYDHLAALELDLGRTEEAALLEKKALDLTQKSGDSLPLYLGELYQLGMMELRLEKSPEAEKTLVDCADESLKKLSQRNPLIVQALTALAQANLKDQHPLEAQNHLEKCLQLCEKNYMANSVQVGDALEKLADFYHVQGQDEKAQPYYDQALAIFKSYVGSTPSYNNAASIEKTATLDESAGNHLDAEKILEKELKILKEALLPTHPKIALCLIHLAENEKILGKEKEAQKKLNEALSLLRLSLGKSHPLTQSVQKQLEVPH